MDENGVMEEDDGPWGEFVIISTKPHQENVPWHEYKWRLYVSYQKPNHVTHPFTFPIPHCDDTVQDIDTYSYVLGFN